MLCRYIFVCALLVTSTGIFSGKNYGSYEIKLVSYLVQDYKPFVRVATTHNQFDNGSSGLTFHSVVSRDMGVVGMKTRWFTWDESLKKFSQALNFAVRNLCEKQFAKEILTMIPGLGKDCKLKPGVYNFTITDFNGWMHLITKGKFFYGKFRSVTDVFTDKYALCEYYKNPINSCLQLAGLAPTSYEIRALILLPSVQD